jgi:hypothetical protein
MGTAHAGHDQCAHCFFQYVKPALQAERLAVKRRRAIKKQQLSGANRALISEVDLKEPQMRDQVADAVTAELPVRWIPPVVREQVVAIAQTLAEAEEDMGPGFAAELGADMRDLVKTGVLNSLVVPVDLPKPLEKEGGPTPWIPTPGGATGRRGKPPITDDIRLEIAHAYEAGEPVLTIARRHDVARGTVLNIAKELGVNRHSPATESVAPPEEVPEVPIKTRTTIEVPHDTPLPVTQPRAVITANGIAGAVGTWKVTFTVTRTETIEIKADSLTSAARGAQVNLPEGSEVVSLERVG